MSSVKPIQISEIPVIGESGVARRIEIIGYIFLYKWLYSD